MTVQPLGAAATTAGLYSAEIAEAFRWARQFKPNKKCEAGTVAAYVRAASGRTYTGVSVEFPCGMGFCAEHSAVAEMLKHHETHVALVVAVHRSGEVLPPCGRCRELIWLLDKRNRDTAVVLEPDLAKPLHELLPHPWA